MDTLDALGFDRLSKTDIFTPVKITQDMVNLLPEEVFHPDFKFLDIACKSGRFLVTLKDRLMESPTMIEIFPDKKDRLNHILNNQLFGLATSEMCLMISTRNLYGSISEFRNIRYIANYTDKVKEQKINIEYLEKEFNRDMKIDVVIGNPPYNKGMDLDFVNLGYNLSTQYCCMITPAKWQTAEAEQRTASSMSYGEFRKKIVPHMSYVCFYPNCSDLFLISQDDGISWYFISKTDSKDACIVENKCKNQSYLNNKTERSLINGITLNNHGAEIIGFLSRQGIKLGFTHSYINGNKKYSVVANNKYNIERGVEGQYQAYGMVSYKTGEMSVVCRPRVIESKNKTKELTTADGIVYESNDILECESFMSWFNTKFVRFMVSLNISRISPVFCDYAWRFVPAPPSGKFDHIYTDQELYEAFNLPQKYIDVIEAVIKKRK